MISFGFYKSLNEFKQLLPFLFIILDGTNDSTTQEEENQLK